MSEIQNHPYRVAEVIGLSTATIVVGGITIGAHRVASHESLELTPSANAVASLATWLTGTVSEVWSDVHIGPHHQIRDVNLVPIIETGDFLTWHDEHSEVGPLSIPEQFSNLDPAAELSPEDIRQIRNLAREIKIRRGEVIKDLYEPPSSYSAEEAERLLDTETTRYFYEDKPSKELPVEGSLEGIAHLLRDPTSPALHKYGFFGVLIGGIGLYRRPARIFARERDLTNDYDTSTWHKRLNVNHKKWGPVFLFAANIGGRLGYKAARGNLTKQSAKESIGTGITSAVITSGALLAGSNIVNAAGHINTEKVMRLLHQRDWNGAWHELLRPNAKEENGTYTNDADGVGLGIMTQDEAARQAQHHLWPSKIAFTNKTGLKKFREAPYGTMLEFFARHKILGLRPGKQFGNRENPEDYGYSKRPDMPAEAVLLLESFRIRTMTKKSLQE